MSHRATVAYDTGDGTFDLHYSHNGAENYALKPVLEEYLDGNVPKDAGDMPGFLPREAADLAADLNLDTDTELETVEHELIDTNPRAENITPEEFSDVINFFNTETLYVVRDWNVEIFAPIHLTPTVLTYLNHAANVKIYNLDNHDNSMQEVIGDSSIQPDHHLTEPDFTSPDTLDALPDDVYALLKQYHLEILEFYNRVHHNVNDHRVYNMLADNYLIQYSMNNPQKPVRNHGIFINTWGAGDTEPKYPWNPRHDTNEYPRDIANEIRLNISKTLVEDITNLHNTPGKEFETKAGQKLLVDYEQKGTATFLIELLDRFGDDLSREYISPNLNSTLREVIELINTHNEG